MDANTLAARDAAPQLARLRRAVRGAVLVPGAEGYDDARSAWNSRVAQRPAVIVIPEHADDVVEAVRYARVEGLPVAVQATGHGIAAPADGALLVATRRLDSVAVDPATCTATVGAGVRWRELLAAAAPHGLTGLAGSSPDVGVVGSTLGGGLGWLARRYGLASDGVVAFGLVTPDGLHVTTTADRHPELFWALKGGGAGLLGIVTSMEIELHHVERVHAGTMVFPLDATREVIARWREWVTDARRELTSQVLVEPAGVSVRGCWCGDGATGRAMLDEWRTWRTPVRDDWAERRPHELESLGEISDGLVPEGITNEWLPVVRDEVVDVLVDVATGDGPRVGWAGIRHVGGAVRARSEAAVNGRGRTDAFLVELCGGTPAARAAARVRLAPYVTGATFLNLVDGDERRERTPTSFSDDHLARLRAVKTALDPTDRFRHGLAVHPEPDRGTRTARSR
jgi:FAD/FMN-containing dehydrogenase